MSDPTHGRIQFVPNPFQAELLLQLAENRVTFACSVLAGKTTGLLVHALWKAMFWRNAQVFIRPSNRAIGYIYASSLWQDYLALPEHLRVIGAHKADALTLAFDNGSRIHFMMNRFSLHGVNWPTVLVDEFHRDDEPVEAWYPPLHMQVLAQRGTLAMVATPSILQAEPPMIVQDLSAASHKDALQTYRNALGM